LPSTAASFFSASSAEFVGELGFRKMPKLMIQRGFDSPERAKAEGFSHGQFGFEVQAPLLSTTEIYVSRGRRHTLRDHGGQI